MAAPVPTALHVLGWSTYESYLSEGLAEELRSYVSRALGIGLSADDVGQDILSKWGDRFSSVSVEVVDVRGGMLAEVVCIASRQAARAGNGMPIAA